MKKTLVQALHRFDGPPGQNRVECMSREAGDGHCPGEEVAVWLNSLDDDASIYLKASLGSAAITCGEVRQRWLARFGHLAPANRVLDSTPTAI